MFYIIFIIILPTIFTLLTFICLKYLQYKNKITWVVVIFTILGLQILNISFITANVIITNKIAEKKYYAIVDPTGENDGIFNYNDLTEEEKKVVDYYFQDTGRNVAPIILGIYFGIIFIALSFISIIMDIYRKRKQRVLRIKKNYEKDKC